MIDKNRLMETLLELCAVPGISGTESENLTAVKVYEQLSRIEYFRENSEDLKLMKLENDSFNRHFVTALFKGIGKSKKTVILMGHIDVVDIEEYGHLKGLAFNPVEFTKRVKELKLDSDSLRDLESGEWLFGRGVADMKYGIALKIELMREFSKLEGFEGNILFLGVPGEESNSEGMLGAAKFLAELQREQGYEYIALLLPECYMYEDLHDNIRRIHIGACGKLMPMFFFVGKETHAVEPYAGIDPLLLASEVNRLLNLNIDFCEFSRGAVTPPPICLKQMDLKTLYSVQTPIYAVSYYNILTLEKSSEEILLSLKEICTRAVENAVSSIEESRRRYEDKYSIKVEKCEAEPKVITYKELYEKVSSIYGGELEEFLDEKIREWDEKGIDTQTKAIYIIKEIYEKYPEKDPMIIIAFEPPFYPGRYPKEDSENMKKLLRVIEGIIEQGRSVYRENFKKEDYYMGIGDLSYTGLEDESCVKAVYSNMPGAGKIYELPVESLKQLDIPGIVLGAFGKDMHKYTERLNIPFSIGVLPDIYEYAIKSLLEE